MENEDTRFVPPEEKIKEILDSAKVIAVVGLSERTERPSNRIGKFLKGVGYTVIPVNPNYDIILGLKSYPSLLDVPIKVDIVNVFRRPETVVQVVDAAIRIGAKVVWMQEGVINIEAAQRAKDAGITVIMDLCIYKEYDRLFMQG